MVHRPSEGTPEVYVLDATVDENNGTVDMIVALSHRGTTDSTVNFTTSDDTAIAGDDYTAVVDDTVTIGAGNTAAWATVHILEDSTVEPDETFTLTISDPVNP